MITLKWFPENFYMINYKTYTTLLFLTCIIIFINDVYSQRQADHWYFGYNCGLNFNSGEPEVLYTGRTHLGFGGVGTMSDSLGNLLFYSEGDTVFTSQHTVMENGLDFAEAHGMQSNLIVQWPESDSLYLLFQTPTLGDGMGLYYSIIDISLNNGLGAVIEKDVLLNHAWDAGDKVTAALHKNKRDIWVITRKFRDDNFAVFLITPEGINEIPILSPASDMGEHTDRGFIKISYDKKFLFSNYWGSKDVEVCNFNNETGEIELHYILNTGINPDGIEFSPDSKFAYISYQTGNSSPVTIKQYNMDYVDDVSLFISTAIDIGTGIGYGLQLATDGKIYCMDNAAYLPGPEYFVGVINRPWEIGVDCQYDSIAINMYPSSTSTSVPNIFMDYLYRFEFEGICAGIPFQFTSNFNPIPDSIRWLFNDPSSGLNNVSYELNPEHTFTYGGIYEVEVDVWYPSGRFEHTSRVVEVAYTPLPELGPDTLVCEGTSFNLNAGSDPGLYVWSTGTFGQNLFSITVSDTGTYWVIANSDEGCRRTDSIHVGWLDKSVIDETTLVITPASCGVNNGSITGLQVGGVEPFSFNWYDGNGNLISPDIDITDLSVGNYFLHVTDGNGCITISDSYTIIDGGDILITAVDFSSAHCMQNNGFISITASSVSGNNFEYSIDNGNTWQTDNLFENLNPDNYFIWVKDQSGCETVYDNNPVVIENTEGPQIITVDVTPENDFTSNGSIFIDALIGSGDILYSIDSGYNFQTNNGLFENLNAETYYCMVKDEFGCDTTFIVEIERIISQIIDAIAGDGYTCIGNATASPLLLNNFTDVYNFFVVLSYDKDLIECDGYIQVHPDLEDGFQVSVVPALGEVHITWQGQSPTSLPYNSLMAELVFSGIDEGLSQIDWVAEQGESQFYNENGDMLNTDFELGLIIIYTRPNITFNPSVVEVCEGEMALITPSVSGGTGEYDSYWSGPDNFTSNFNGLWFGEVTSNMAGIYTITVTDTINCIETKSMELIVYLEPAIDFAPYDTLWVDPGYLLEAGFGADSYIWNTGETTESIIIDTIGSYNVEVASYEGCKSTDTVQILWGGTPFYMPNAFTPNGDGLNDVFGVVQKNDYVNQFHMSIFNRWGQMIYETSDINKGWDGTYKGSQCILGAYVYRIVYEEFGQQPVESKTVEGTVMLIR